jgi:hypothetical protein
VQQSRKRLDRIESQTGCTAPRPSVIFLCEAETGEPVAAMVMGGGTLTREDGETVDGFEGRANADAAMVAYLPDNGREALATG